MWGFICIWIKATLESLNLLVPITNEPTGQQQQQQLDVTMLRKKEIITIFMDFIKCSKQKASTFIVCCHLLDQWGTSSSFESHILAREKRRSVLSNFDLLAADVDEGTHFWHSSNKVVLSPRCGCSSQRWDCGGYLFWLKTKNFSAFVSNFIWMPCNNLLWDIKWRSSAVTTFHWMDLYCEMTMA